ncbi:uncharacterized protein PHALS_15306 [Plasmopara halstedii]|uniref:Uncharacterized protein n=1 Tax=Plasmopara halstedii TaxID=4781 RepID=A0A0P1ABY1_PLAHL|nr:uncharacterized protein PHALS_15306 [Plasmopara halstedii]CEG38438.1 hypothetical protein PHALS_15306 [Plasmopara halstedii]|eukprot:XP_024574807.1 hypothetical protein PHALS_15306 [Plasmopara halstedii]
MLNEGPSCYINQQLGSTTHHAIQRCNIDIILYTAKQTALPKQTLRQLKGLQKQLRDMELQEQRRET